MTKMAAMPIYGKNPSKIFSRTGGPISTKLDMKHRWLKHYNIMQACGNTMPDLPDSVHESAGQAMFQDLLVHGQVKKNNPQQSYFHQVRSCISLLSNKVN